MIIPRKPPLDLSVIVTTHSGYAQYLGEAVSSVLSQTCSPREILVIDTSPEEDKACQAALQEVVQFNSVQVQTRGIRIVHERVAVNNQQVSRNKGLSLATSTYVAFLDADDVLDLVYCELMYSHALESGADVVYSQYFRISDAEKELMQSKDVRFHNLESGNFIAITALVKREVVVKAGGFDEDVDKVQEWCLWLKLKRLGAYFKFVPLPLFYVRLHKKSLTFSRSSEQALVLIRNRYLGAGGGVVCAVKTDGKTPVVEERVDKNKLVIAPCSTTVIVCAYVRSGFIADLRETVLSVMSDAKADDVRLVIALDSGIDASEAQKLRKGLDEVTDCKYFVIRPEGRNIVGLQRMLNVSQYLLDSQYTIFVSAGMTLFSGWYKQMMSGLRQYDLVGVILSPVSWSWHSIDKLGESLFGAKIDAGNDLEVSKSIASQLLSLRGSMIISVPESFVSIKCCGFKTASLRRAGYFEEKFLLGAVFDIEFADRIRGMGGAIGLAQGIYALVRNPQCLVSNNVGSVEGPGNIELLEKIRRERKTKKDFWFRDISHIEERYEVTWRSGITMSCRVLAEKDRILILKK